MEFAETSMFWKQKWEKVEINKAQFIHDIAKSENTKYLFTIVMGKC
jgi:hypothetical protein